jgi:anaerobic magnesium-protoporphyrin IX monomethyl ester cyclase
LAGGGEPSGILGLSYLQDGKVVHNVDRPPQKDLDRFPFPAYDLLDPGKYGVTRGRARRFPAASIIMSRDCPYSCHFCQAGRQGKSYRSRSAGNVLEEIEQLHQRYQIREFAFQDDVLTSNRKNLMALCELLQQRGLDIEWSCLSRVDAVDGEMLRGMQAAGCRQIGFGVESGNDEILRSIGKNTTVSQARKAVRLAREADLEVVTYFILGLPGETRETLEETFQLSRELKPDYSLYNILTPLPGTEIYNRAREEGRLTTSDWGRYTASEAIMEVPGLSGDYIQSFYRKAYLRFYLDPGFLLRRLKKVRSVSELLDGGRSFLKLLRL